MAKKMSQKLKRALEVFEIGELEIVINRKRREDFEALRSFVTKDPDVDPEHRQRAMYAMAVGVIPKPCPT